LKPRPLRHEPAETKQMVHTHWPKIKWLIYATGNASCGGTCKILDVDTWVPISFTLTPQQKCILCGFLLTALILLILPTIQHIIYVAHTFILPFARHSLSVSHLHDIMPLLSVIQQCWCQ
jgi:hypothetical protein